MLLTELGDRISDALRLIHGATTLDKSIVDNGLNNITQALLCADVPFNLVRKLRINISRSINFEPMSNPTKIVQVIFDELCAMIDGGKPSFVPTKGKPNVIIFVGSQWSDTTDVCSKYAHYHKRIGWKPAIVSTNSSGARAFVQLKQYAIKSNIPFYGRKEAEDELDRTEIAEQGVDTFKEENMDLIIVDTINHHKQENALFEETRRVSEVVKSNLVVLVIDGSIGQAAVDQVQSFRVNNPTGVVILTKLHPFTNAETCGALSVIASAKCPIIFIDNGDPMTELQAFDARRFLNSLTGGFMGPMKKIYEDLSSLFKQLEIERIFTLRTMYDHLWKILSLPPSELLSSLTDWPDAEFFSNLMDSESKSTIKRFLAIMDSMTNKELDSSKPKQIMNGSRVIRVARGSGCKVGDVRELLDEHELLTELAKRKIWKQMHRPLPRVTHENIGKSVVLIMQMCLSFKFMGISK